MSNTKPTPHNEKSDVTTDKLHRKDSETLDESLLASAKKRESDILDGLTITGDILENLLVLIRDLMFRMRQMESAMNAEKKSSSGGCGLNCVNNALNL